MHLYAAVALSYARCSAQLVRDRKDKKCDGTDNKHGVEAFEPLRG